jgi:serine protease Do
MRLPPLPCIRTAAVAVMVSLLTGGAALGQTPPAADKKTPTAAGPDLRAVLNDLHVLGGDFWIYNNFAAAVQEARRSNRPIFVTFRCVPCKACAGFDAEVAKGSAGIQRLAREKFVSLRQVEMKGVDLSQFQFDYDLNWAAMFINADGTVYGRYGTQSAAGPDAYNSIESLERAMERVLELHEDYERVKGSLAAKRGPDKPYKTALDMPGMENREKLAGGTARNNCVHCHMIHDAEQNQWSKAGELTRDKLYRWPLPDNVGLHIDPRDGRRVERVEPDGPAARAGIAPGDEITHANGQPVVSIADVQWVLHNTPDEDAARVELTRRRGGQSETNTLTLAKGWRKTDFLWRGSRWGLKPQPGFWAPAMTDVQLTKFGDAVPDGARPLRVQWINVGRAEGRAARDAGLREGDVIVGYEGKPITFATPEAFQMHVRLKRRAGETMKLAVLRDGKRLDVAVPLLD